MFLLCWPEFLLQSLYSLAHLVQFFHLLSLRQGESFFRFSKASLQALYLLQGILMVCLTAGTGLFPLELGLQYIQPSGPTITKQFPILVVSLTAGTRLFPLQLGLQYIQPSGTTITKQFPILVVSLTAGTRLFPLQLGLQYIQPSGQRLIQ